MSLDFADLGVGGEEFIAAQVVKARQKLKKSAPSRAALATAITAITYEDTFEGSSTLTVSVSDPFFELIEFFDVDTDGYLDVVDVNWPDGSDYWWRLTQLEMDDAPGATTFDLVFMERIAVLLMRHHGPVKATRGKETRAEFIDHTATKAVPAIRFHSRELHDKQPVANPDVSRPSRSRADKGGGFDGSEKLFIKGQKATKGQLHLLDAALAEVEPLRPPDNAVLGMVCAAIGESTVSNVVNSAGYGGLLQGQVAVPGGTNWFANMSATERAKQEAKSFMQGGRGYQGGGAIHLAKQAKTPGEIADTVEAGGAGPHFYGQHLDEASKLVDAWGGGFGGSTVYYRKKYHFTIGTEENPHESYWAAYTRMAQEVNWRFFVDGLDVYYDSDMALIKQKPIAVIRRGDPQVVRVRGNWDSRRIATECEIELVCDPTEFRAGEVFLLEDFGLLSRGSTAHPKKRPGYWLVSHVSWQSGTFVTTFTLNQPQNPKKEPAPDIGSKQIESGATGKAADVINWAKKMVGTQEGSGRQVRWAKDLHLSPSLPWCSIFIATDLGKNTDLPMPSNPAYSGAWLNWKGGRKVRLSSIEPGDLCVFDWGDGGITDHVALYVGNDQVIGGNQGNQVSQVKLDKGHVVGVVRPKYG
jgi:cell wall-associated NlpC family hydrolase